MTEFAHGFVTVKPRPLRLVRDSCLTPMGDAALDYADQMDRVVLEMHVQAKVWGARTIVLYSDEPVDRADLEPVFEGLVARGYLRPAGSGYVVTPAGEAATALATA